MQISTAGRRGRGKRSGVITPETLTGVCVCARVQERETDREGLGIQSEESRMWRATLFSLPVEMETLREGEEKRGVKECAGKQGYGGERFVCISLEEMESYYRYAQCCQQLHGEFGSFKCGVWGLMLSQCWDGNHGCFFGGSKTAN